MSTLLYPSSGYFRQRGKVWSVGEGTDMSFMVLVLVVRAVSFLAERPMFEGMGTGVSAMVRGSWDKGVVASLSDVILIEECCVYRCQGFCQLLRVSAISVLCVLGEALLIRSLQSEWLFVMPGIVLIDYLVWLHKGSGCQGFNVSRSCQHSCSVGTMLGFNGTKVAAKVTVWKPDLCNAPSGALGSPMWTREVTQGNSEGTGFSEDPSMQNGDKG
jgi:hypothetical protein